MYIVLSITSDLIVIEVIVSPEKIQYVILLSYRLVLVLVSYCVNSVHDDVYMQAKDD